MVKECVNCGRPCADQYTRCMKCNKEGAQKPKKAKSDSWRKGAIEGHLDTLTLHYCLKFSKNTTEFWQQWDGVRARFEEKIKKVSNT